LFISENRGDISVSIPQWEGFSTEIPNAIAISIHLRRPWICHRPNQQAGDAVLAFADSATAHATSGLPVRADLKSQNVRASVCGSAAALRSPTADRSFNGIF
jgi:hypothetical protein